MSREWYFQVMGQDIGPLTGAELRSKVTTGQIQPDTLIRKGAEGKWVFAMSVKGLLVTPSEPPPIEVSSEPLPPPPTIAPEPSSDVKPSSRGALPPAHDFRSSGNSRVPTSIPIADDPPADANSGLHEFYDFVGFRDAISPRLYDVAKQFVTDWGITFSQLNRRALADFIRRPELGGDLSIVAFAPSVAEDAPLDSGDAPADHALDEPSTMRVTIRNRGDDSLQLREGVFLLTDFDEQSDAAIIDTVRPTPDHSHDVSVRLGTLAAGKTVRFPLDASIPPHGARQIVIWLHEARPKLVKVHGRLLFCCAGDFVISEPFSLTLHS